MARNKEVTLALQQQFLKLYSFDDLALKTTCFLHPKIC
jgi:hypothetical protein